MITLYTSPTPSGRKISIALEEMGLPYTTRIVNIGKGEQFAPEFLAISPNNRMPAIVDPDGPDGTPTGAVFGVANMLVALFTEYKPSHVAVAMDSKTPTFRKEIFPEYKANRPPPPDDLQDRLGDLFAPFHGRFPGRGSHEIHSK